MSDQTTWHWQDLNSWHDAVWAMLTDIGVGPDVVDAIRQAPPEYLVGDDLSWLERVVQEIVGESMEIKHELACTLREHFDAIRAFHCARPRDVQSYYQHGIRLLDAAEQNEVIREIFLSGNFPEVTAAHVDEAIQYVGPKLRHGRAYFDAHERELVESCGHYMLYGSEYITAVAAHIQGPRDYRQALKTRGTPTVFVCDVPIASMHRDAVEEFAGVAVKALFKRLLDPTFEHPQPHDGGGICLRCALPADRIIRHYHPTHIADPLLGYRVTSI